MCSKHAPAATTIVRRTTPTLIAAIAIVVGDPVARRRVHARPAALARRSDARAQHRARGHSRSSRGRSTTIRRRRSLYLWIERLAVSVGGVSERSLRALPFVAGVALVPLVWVVARRLAGATTAALATVLVALSRHARDVQRRSEAVRRRSARDACSSCGSRSRVATRPTDRASVVATRGWRRRMSPALAARGVRVRRASCCARDRWRCAARSPLGASRLSSPRSSGR